MTQTRRSLRDARSRPKRSWRGSAVDLLALAALLLLATTPLMPVYGGRAWLVAPAAGVAGGLVLALLGARLQLKTWLLVPLAAAAYLLLGGPVAVPEHTSYGLLPSRTSVGWLAELSYAGPRQVLTFTPPLGRAGGLLAVPLMLTLVAALAAGSAALRTRRSWLAVVPVGALLLACLALGARHSWHPHEVGVAMVLLALGWTSVRRPWTRGRRASHSADPSRLRAVTSLALLLALLGGASLAAAALSPPDQRAVLREELEPPFDVRDYPSPLLSYRRYAVDEKTTTMMVVSGLPTGGRVRVAVLDSWDGVVWFAAGGEETPAGSGTYARVGEVVADVPGAARRVSLRLEGYDAPWLPVAGPVRRFDFGRGASTLNELFYNRTTTTGLVRTGLPGERYTLETVLPSERDDDLVAGLPASGVILPTTTRGPEELTELGDEAIGEARTTGAQMLALERYLRTNGYYSDGGVGEATSAVGHGADRLVRMTAPSGLIGNSEQYASLMAVIARDRGVPARVVMGFAPRVERSGSPESLRDDGTYSFTGGHVRAWVEVALEGQGWVAFDPTPPTWRTQPAPEPEPQPKPQPLVKPAPQQPREPDPEPPKLGQQTDPAEDEHQEEDGAVTGVSRRVLYVGAGAVGLALPFVLLLTAKAWRRRRRARSGPPSRRVAAGWDELVDTARDLGLAGRGRSTRMEFVRVTAGDDQALVQLARAADAGVFGPGEPTDADVAGFWAEVRTARRRLRGRARWWRRLLAPLSLRSLSRRRNVGVARG